MVEATRVHPALPRFLRWADPASRLLLVRAAPETGRTWFAKSWRGDRKGAVHDFSERPFEALEELEKISLQLAQDPQLHAAVVLAPGHTVWHPDEAEEDLVQKSTSAEDSAEAPQPSEKDDKLADTGFTALYVLVAGLLLAAAGVLISRRSNRRHG